MPLPSPRPIRVLVIDSDEASRTAISAALEWDSCDVSLAPSAHEALEVARRAPPDIVVLGASVARALGPALRAGILRDVPVIACCDHSGIPLFADAVLPSPLDAFELIATVRLLRRSRLVESA